MVWGRKEGGGKGEEEEQAGRGAVWAQSCLLFMPFCSERGGGAAVKEKGRMADDCCDFNKDALMIKSPKKSPLILRMIVLAFAMICGMYICSVCLKQSRTYSETKIMRVNVLRRPCQNANIPLAELPLLHYPKPKNFSREECACTPVRYFAILSMQRSGSGWFETLLNSHINISSNGEIFSARDRRSNMSAINATLNKVYDLDWFSSAAKNECTAAVGFKWMLNQGIMQHHEEIVEYFNRRGVSAIFLFRRNWLRRMVSVIANSHDRYLKLLNGTHKSHVHSQDEASILASYKPTINASLVITDLKQAEQWAADALKYFKSTRHIILFYEDLMKNQTKLTDVLEFLKVPKRKLVSRQVKIHTKPLAEQIQNWEAILGALKGTQYESFLNADYQL